MLLCLFVRWCSPGQSLLGAEAVPAEFSQKPCSGVGMEGVEVEDVKSCGCNRFFKGAEGVLQMVPGRRELDV
jgi:hypothetical protein